jgi:hypothetical protein
MRSDLEIPETAVVQLPSVVPDAVFETQLTVGEDGSVWEVTSLGRRHRMTSADLRKRASEILLLATIEEHWAAQPQVLAWHVAEIRTVFPNEPDAQVEKLARRLIAGRDFATTEHGQTSPLP